MKIKKLFPLPFFPKNFLIKNFYFFPVWFFWLCILNKLLIPLILWLCLVTLDCCWLYYPGYTRLPTEPCIREGTVFLLIPEEAFGAPKLSSICTRPPPRLWMCNHSGRRKVDIKFCLSLWLLDFDLWGSHWEENSVVPKSLLRNFKFFDSLWGNGGTDNIDQ